MQVQYRQISESWQALAKISTLDLPAKKAITLARFMRQAGEAYKDIEEQREKLVRKYGIENGGNIVVAPDKMATFIAEFNEMLDTTVELPHVCLTEQDLEESKVSALTLLPLEWLLQSTTVNE